MKDGRTLVECYRVEVNENAGAEKHVLCKKGVVLQQFGKPSFARVYDNRPVRDGGDPHVIGEVLPINGKRGYMRVVGELKERNAVVVPPSF